MSSTPFSPIRHGLPGDFPPLENDVACDVAIIGAGVTGALAALHVAEAGFSVVVLDRRDVAHGSTAGSTGFLQYEIDVPLHRLIRKIGEQDAIASYRACRDAVRHIGALVRRLRLKADFAPRASLLLASRPAHEGALRREFAARTAAGFSVEWWDQKKIAARSTLPHSAAILSHRGEAGEIDAYRFTHGLLAAARAAGAIVCDRTTVTRTRRTARGVVLTTDRGACVRARTLVVAAGYEADALVPEKVTSLHSTFALMSEPVAAFPGWPADRALIWETAEPYVYFRTTVDGRILLGGFDEPFRDPVARDRLVGVKTTALVRRFHRWFPQIKLEVACAWAGTFATTPDGLPFIGSHRERPHTFFALGYGGNGITYSLTAARILRDRLLGRANREARLFEFGRQRSASLG
ncbi:MAG: FAD-dependent oxidoreductase [Opitutaceae bacterium]